ncbi:general odorant-binding protein 28a-like [Musca autumnalis]|uniref:general odorant-binding protein 28a-like n=1 Tax=Musca autumnalis TaxID=221902 RepID=UPI003CFB433D
MKIITYGIIFTFVTLVRGGFYTKPAEWCSGDFLLKAASRCGAAHGTTEADFHQYINLKPATSQAAKCFRACIFNECKLFNGDHTFSSDLARRTAALTSYGNLQLYKIMQELANICIQHIRTGEDTCDAAETFLKCYVSNSPIPITLQALF